MPTAQPFTALGVGNGFPACLQTIQESEIEGSYVLLDLQEMMQLFWNIKGASATGSASYSQDASGSNPALSVEASGTVTASMEEEPYKRVCPDFVDSDSDTIEDTDSGNFDPDMGTGVTASAFVSVNVNTIPVVDVYRVLNGSALAGYTFRGSMVVASAGWDAFDLGNFGGGVSKQITGWTTLTAGGDITIDDIVVDGITLKLVTIDSNSSGATISDPDVTFYTYT